MADVTVDEFLAGYTPQVRELTLAARQVLLGMLPPDAYEKAYPGWKIIGLGTGPRMDEMAFGLKPLKDRISIVLPSGADLPDPHGLLEGASKTGRSMKITSLDQLRSQPVREMLDAAWAWKRAAPAAASAEKPSPRKKAAAKPATDASASAGTPAAAGDAPPAGDDAVREATGRTWAEWFAVLDEAGAADKPHAEIVAILAQHHAVGPWWQQMVTVGYERARGLRQKNQTTAGYQVGASRTLSAALARLWAAWNDPTERGRWLPEPFTVRKATENKSMRITWNDGTRVEVLFYAKGDARSQVTIDHRGLDGADAVEQARAFWRTRLDALKTLLEG
jgi:hypothetical protein